ncbi:MAG: Spy/CpxP family protein refolding chaperone [Gemmatimonadaceae bacterium]
MLLAQTGELELTDAQVVRLAAIARRSEARRRSLRASMDSAESRLQPGDTVARRQFGERMRANMTRAQEQQQIDQRDAIAVLTPDQQAKAWNRVANRPDRGMRRPGGFGMRERRMEPRAPRSRVPGEGLRPRRPGRIGL